MPIVIFGAGRSVKSMWRGPEASCPNCEETETWVVARSFHYFSLFFAPLIQWKIRYHVVCPACDHGYELKSRAVAVHIAELAEAEWPDSLIQAEQAVAEENIAWWKAALIASTVMAVLFAYVAVRSSNGDSIHEALPEAEQALDVDGSSRTTETVSTTATTSASSTTSTSTTEAPTTTAGPTSQEVAIEFFEDGIAAFEAGDIEGALALFGQAIGTEPTFLPPYFSRGIVLYYDFGRIEEARADFEAAIAFDPSFFPGYYGLGIIQYETGENAAAISSLETFLDLSDTEDDFTTSARDIVEYLRSL